MKYRITFIIACVLIFLLKFPEPAGLHFTDANNYIFISDLVQHGKVLYRDIHLDNFPLMMYLSIFYKTITFGSMQWFNMTVTVEKIAIAVLLYAIALRFWKKESTAFLVSMTFFFSYTAIANTFQLGFYTTILLILLAYYFTLDKRFILAGICAACAVLIKAHSVFPVFGLFISLAYQYKWKSIQFVVAGLVTTLVVMLPTIVLALPQFIDQTFGYGLVRMALESKNEFYIMFAQYDFLIFILLLWNLTLWKKNLFVAAATASTLVFFVFYRDIYYVYFCYFPLLGALGAGYLLETNLPFTKVVLPKAVYATLFGFAIVFSLSTYMVGDRNMDKIPNEEKLFEAIKKENPDAIYGYSYVTNGISYLTGIRPYKDLYDITSPLFANNNIDRTAFTKEVMKTRTVILVDVLTSPDVTIYDDSIMATQLLKNNCTTTYKHMIKEDPSINAKRYMTVVRCYK